MVKTGLFDNFAGVYRDKQLNDAREQFDNSIAGGHVIPSESETYAGVRFTGSTPKKVFHNLGKLPTGYFAVRCRSSSGYPVLIEHSLTEEYITLESSVDADVVLFVF